MFRFPLFFSMINCLERLRMIFLTLKFFNTGIIRLDVREQWKFVN